jgi:TonB-linked SusC/RagA family outer membrane protein
MDGSPKFGANYRFGTFPSVSAGWVVSEEKFLKNNNLVNFLKIRGSWGVNGNDKIGDFRFVSTIGGFRNYTFGATERLINGSTPVALANPDLRWEETTQTNIGFDAKIFKSINITLDWFKKATTGMLLDIAVPGYVGNAGPVGNIASMDNTGVELELGFNKKLGEFNLEFSGNVSHITNKVTSLGPEKKFLVGQFFSPQGLELSRTSVGEPIGYFYGYKTNGIFQNQAEVNAHKGKDGALLQPEARPGDFRFVDVNGDGKLDADDRTKIGDPTPTWTYGFNLAAAWRGFDLILFAQGVAGNQLFRATRRFDLQMANMTSDALGRWTGEGSTNTYPRLVMNDPNKNFSRSSDFYVEDGAFFRVRTLQLGYTIPLSISSKLGIKKCRIYVSGNNLLTLTKAKGFDPEIGGGSFGVDRGIYPQARFFLVGGSVAF